VKVSEVGESEEKESEKKRRKTRKSSLARQTLESLPCETKGGGREMSKLIGSY